MKLTTKLLLNTSLVGMTLIFTGCVDDGENGATALINTTAEAANGNCANGGTRIDIGLDDNANGILDEAEIDSTKYVCNGTDGAEGEDGEDGSDGADGTDGLTILTNTTAEASGDNCTNGGTRIDIGVDDDDNGTLEESEIDNTSYICNGVGEPGEDGLSTLTRTSYFYGNNGHCFAGGVRIDVGVDDNDDGTLQTDERDSTAYVCNGLSASQEEEKCLVDAGYGTIEVRDANYGFLLSTWLDRNLGASRVAVDVNDTLAFGNYYQWSRGADGHENNDSETNSTRLENWLHDGSTSGGQFITDADDWTNEEMDTSIRGAAWRSSDHANQVCPCGYVVPSVTDFEMVAEGANIEILRLPNAGMRSLQNDGNVTSTSFGGYWTIGEEWNLLSRYIDTDWDELNTAWFTSPSLGLPVRCVKPNREFERFVENWND